MEHVLYLIKEYGYVILFFYSLGGGFFAIVGAGVLSFSGVLDYKISLVVGIASNFVGDIGLFYLGKVAKKEVHMYLKKHRRKLAYSHILIKKYSIMAIFIQKFIYGVKTLVPIAIGLTKYNAKRFIVYNFFASVVFVFVFLNVGFIAGNAILRVADRFSNYPYVAPLVLIGIIVLLNFLLNKAVKR